MEFLLLGPVEVRAAGRAVLIGGPRQRGVIAALAAEAGVTVSVESLIDRVWSDAPPARARHALHVYIARFRRLLRHETELNRQGSVIRRSGGYTLEVDPDCVDVHRFRRVAGQASDASRPDPERMTLFGQALDLWRGPPLADLSGDWPARVRQGWQQQRLEAVQAWTEICLRLGLPEVAVGRLNDLAGEYPMVESIAAALMRALCAAGRPSDALSHYDRVRRLLVDELGTDPGPQLQQLYRQILTSDPAIGSSPASWSPPPVPRQLPAPPQYFTGRAPELAELDRLSDTSTVVVVAIDGMAGIGKTALAVHAAHRCADRFPDGQIFIDLHGFTPDAEPVSPSVALDRMLRALGIPGQKIPYDLDERAALWRTTLADRRVLVLLDNAADERQVRSLLPGAGGCLVLITSRRRMPGLDAARPLSLDLLSIADAVALLVRVSGAADAYSRLAEIVQMCGHLPLAIAIAGARLRSRLSWSTADLVDRLRDHRHRLAQLDLGYRSVTAAVALSYRQLTSDQQRMFRLLGIHYGSHIDVDAAAAMAAVEPSRADQLLRQLVDIHLLLEPTAGRFQCHDLVRAYAAQVADEHETDSQRHVALTRLSDYYRYGAWLAAEQLYPTYWKRRPRIAKPDCATAVITDRMQATAWLDDAQANLLAMAGYAANHELPSHAIDLAQILNRHLEVRSSYGDAETLQGLALDAAVRTGNWRAEVRSLIDLGTVHYYRGEYDHAGRRLRQALSLAEESGEPPDPPSPRAVLGLVQMRLGDLEAARALFHQALDFYRAVGDPAGQSSMLLNLGVVAGMKGRWAESEALFHQGLDHSRATGDRTAEAHALTNLSIVVGESGRYPEAIAHLRRALALHRANKDHTGEVNTIGNLGLIYGRMGQHEQALHHHDRALEQYRLTHDAPGMLESLNDIGVTLRQLDRLSEAAARHQEALALACDTGTRYEQARALDGLAHVHHARGERVECETRWREAMDLFAVLGTPEAAEIQGRLASLPAASSNSK
jgi:DNA-binding SARP family transcriptional activator/tetratricopeptide (TPR) repeat protein